MTTPRPYALLATLALLAVAACAEPTPATTPTQEPAPEPAAVALPPSPTPAREPTAAATPEPTATATPAPSPTPKPTATPTPTPTATPTPEPTPTGTPTATPTLPDPAALQRDVLAAVEAVKTYHSEGTIAVKLSEETEAELISIQFEGEGVPDGDNQGLFTMSVDIEGFKLTFTFETRNVGGISYEQDPLTNEWSIVEEDEEEEQDPFDPRVVGRLDPGSLAVERDFLDGAAVYRLTGTVPDDPEVDRVVLWIAVDDLLVSQLEVEGHTPASEFEGLVPPGVEELFLSGHVRFGRFNEPVEIEIPLLAEAGPAPAALPAVAGPTPTPIASQFGPRALYQSANYPFSIQYPAGWAEKSPLDPDAPFCAFTTACFVAEDGGVLAIAEEDLAALGIGPTTLSGYTDMVISVVETLAPGFQLLSRETLATTSGLTGEMVEASLFAGALKAVRLVYIHEGIIGFNATYIGPNARLAELTELVEYSFGTFEVEEATATTQQEKIPMRYDAPPPMTIDPDAQYTATIHMEKGEEIIIELFPKEAPMTVNSFVFLAREGYYDGVTFHRVIPGFMAQGGDPTGTGTGGPGYKFDNEPSPVRRHDTPGVLSMANAGTQNGKGTNGSQFFITFVPTPALDGYNPDGTAKDCSARGTSCHTVFGKVIEGMDAVKAIAPRDPATAKAPGDAIRTITIKESDGGS